MRIALFDADRELHRNLESLTGIQSIDIMAQWSTEQFDAYIISDKLMPVEEVIGYKQENEDKTFIYLIQNQTKIEKLKQIQIMCSTHGIKFISPYFEGKKLVGEIEKHLFPASFKVQQGRSIAFFGTHPGAGLTTVVRGVAESLSKQVEGRIAVLNLNPWDEGIYEKDHGKSLDDIYTAVKNNNLSHDQLLQAFTKRDGYYVLQGNRDLKKIIHYDDKTVLKLIQMSEELFDLVLLDVGAHMENALSVQGMLSADTHYMITTQERKALFSFIKTQNQIMEWLQFTPPHYLMILNKVSNERSATPRSISQKMNVPLLLELPFIGEETLESIENNTKQISELKDVADIFAQLSRGIIEQYQLETKSDGKLQRTRGLLSLFGNAKTVVKEG